MRFSANWLDDGENVSAEERSTLCELQIFVGHHNVAAWYDRSTRQESEGIVLPAVHLAEGIATHWWHIFGARDVVHEVLPWRMGFALPFLGFEFDGSTFFVSCERSEMSNPELAFLRDAQEHIPRKDAERSLSAFVDQVVARLSAAGLSKAETALSWARVLESRAEAEERAFCEAAGAMGVDPYAASDADAGFIEKAAGIFEDEALIEFLAGLRDLRFQAGTPGQVLEWVGARKPRERSRLPDLPAVAAQMEGVAQPVDGESPWRRGHRVAGALREVLGFDAAEPILVGQIAERLGTREFRREPAPEGIVALVARNDDDVHVHLRHRGPKAWARSAEKFAFARAIGDAICFPETRRSAINGLHRAERQAIGRAFAAEFAAPTEAVLGMWDDGRDIDEIAGHFDVNTMVVGHELDNAGRRTAA